MKIYREQNVLEAALDRMRWVFGEFENIVVSYSGGKDSTVTLRLALQVAEELGRLPLPVLWLDQEIEWQATTDHVKEVMYEPGVKPMWMQFPFVISNATSPTARYLDCWAEDKESEWVHPRDPIAMTENKYDEVRFHKLFGRILQVEFPEGLTANLAGVRCEESPARQGGLTNKATYKHVTWGKKVTKQHYNFYPLYDWTTSDVWKAIHDHDWPYCSPAETPIWMGDFSFKRIDDVRVGDTVVGFTDPENGERSKLRKATVERVQCRKSKVVKITLESGRTVRCTEDHRWLRNPNDQNGNWRYGAVKVGDNMAHVIDPWEAPDDEKLAGWLGGMYDGEGNEQVISQSPTHNPDTCAELERAFDHFDIPYKVVTHKTHNVNKYRITGGRQNLAKFLSYTKPVKKQWLESAVLSTRYRNKDRVVSIEPDGEEAVYSLQTESGNYVAWGYASSNCTIYDQFYRYGVALPKMRVSNLNHETSLESLLIAHEIEPETWNRVQARLQGTNTAKTLGDKMMEVPELPFMFEDWQEYRDFLLEKLITDEEVTQVFLRMFENHDRRFERMLQKEHLWKHHVRALLLNDLEAVTVNNFFVRPHTIDLLRFWKGSRHKNNLQNPFIDWSREHETPPLPEFEKLGAELRAIKNPTTNRRHNRPRIT